MSKTNIEWCKRPGTLPEVWNVVTGCTKVSQGCKNCYAEVMHRRLQGMYPQKYQQDFLLGAVEHEELLTLPLKWKTPRTVFVNSMSDLFHENISFEFINAVFTVMSDLSQHTFIILSKRAQRMFDFSIWKKENVGIQWRPSDNVWLGVSIENQETADERIPYLLKIPSKVRLLSCEPLLGPIDLEKVEYIPNGYKDVLNGFSYNKWGIDDTKTAKIDWVIVGGESGHKARSLNYYWVNKIKVQCKEANIPFFFKQWGEYFPTVLNNVGLHRYDKVGKKKAGNKIDDEVFQEFPV